MVNYIINKKNKKINSARNKLLDILEKFNGDEKIQLGLSPQQLAALLFEKNPVTKSRMFFIKPATEIIKKIDLTGLSFDGIDITDIDFTGSKGVKINPQTVYKKRLVGVVLKDVDLVGSFDKTYLCYVDFTGSRGAEIDPQKVLGKRFTYNKLTDVKIIGSFDDVCIIGNDFTGSDGARINPQKIQYKNLDKTILTDVELIGSLENISTNGTIFQGCINNLDDYYLEEAHTLKKKSN